MIMQTADTHDIDSELVPVWRFNAVTPAQLHAQATSHFGYCAMIQFIDVWSLYGINSISVSAV